jgi:hypothetical protein
MDSQKKAQSAPPAAGRPTETLRAVSDGATALAPVPESSAAPSSETEWRDQLHRVLLDLGMAFTADGVEHSSIAVLPGELHFSTPKDLMLGMKADDINQAVKQIAGRPMRIMVTAVTAGTAVASPVERRAKPAAAAEDEVTERALADEEVQKFRRLFGGQVRMVRNLKES